MARTKGAKDKVRRKQPIPRSAGQALQQTPAAGETAREATHHDSPPPAAGPIPPDEFKAAIATELHKASMPQAGPASPTTVTMDSTPAPAFEPGALTMDGLAAAWQLPFYALGVVLAWLRITPDAEPIYAVGRRRAKDLARPSYTLYEHFCREYLAMNPDNAVHVAAGATALNFVGILPEIIDAVVAARRKAAAAAQQPAQPTVPGAT